MDGAIYSPANRYNHVEEGLENKEYDGILVFKNGDTLIKRLKEDKYIKDIDVDEPKDVSSINKFFYFLENRKDEDGAYIYESSKRLIMRVSKIKDPDEIPIEGKIPLDFIYYNGMNGSSNPWKDIHLKLGTKTRLAIDLTQIYPDIHAYQIKRSGYTKLGMGKVTHFTSNGLNEEFFFIKDSGDYNGKKYINPEHKIVGVHRIYTSPDSNLRTSEIINPLIKYSRN